MSFEQAIEFALGTEAPALPAAPTLREGPGRSTDALTRREREIATLVARELTNRQIAEELSISEHTVATHVRNILKKLGLCSRTQISTWS